MVDPRRMSARDAALRAGMQDLLDLGGKWQQNGQDCN